MAEKSTQANLGFEQQLWAAACVLWGSIPAADYRQIIVGLIFLKVRAKYLRDHPAGMPSDVPPPAPPSDAV